MARDFTKNTSNYMTIGVGSLGTLMNGAAFISVHCWANVDTIDSGVNDNALFSGWVAANLNFITFRIDGSGATKVLRVAGRSVSTDAYQARNATSSFTTGTWHSCGGACNFAGDTITPYFNGAAENGGAVTFANATYTDSSTGRSVSDAIGDGNNHATTAAQTDGRIAEIAFWWGSRALTANEFGSLAKGFSPKQIGADLSRIYFNLLGNNSPEKDIFRGLSGTITGTVAKAAHPRVYMPRAQIIQFPSAAAPASTIPPLYRQRQMQGMAS